MLVTTLTNGLSQAVPTLRKDIDFRCLQAVCYGVGAVNHGRLLELQSVIRELSGVKIAVDGRIGKETLAAAQKAAQEALKHPATAGAAHVERLAAGRMDIETFTSLSEHFLQVFEQALALRKELAPEVTARVQQIIRACRTNPRDPVCVQAKAGCQRVWETPEGRLPAVQKMCGDILAARPSYLTSWWVVGLLALGVAGYLVWRR